MSYIYPHSNPEIKTGSMALYREKKPEFGNQIHPDLEDKENFDEGLDLVIKGQRHNWAKPLRKELAKWQQSRIAYLKEPEFKVGSELNHLRTNEKWVITVIQENGISLRKIAGRPHFQSESLGNLKKYYSHYYPGQQEESFKYVREEFKFKSKPPNYGDLIGEWQEVEEPAEYINTYNIGSGADSIGFPIPLPNEIENLETNPKYTQFQAEINKAKILAEITNQL